MLNWFRRREINRLLCERAKYETYCEGYDGQANYVSRWERGQLAEVNERLRQLGYKEQDNG